MKKLILPLLISFLSFNTCQNCDYSELIPSIVVYAEILNENTNEDLVLGDSPTLQLSDIQLTHVKGEKRQTKEMYLDLPRGRRDSLLSIGFLFVDFNPALTEAEYPDTTFINYSGIYPQDTLLIDYWHSDNNCESSDDYPDNFSLRLNGQSICEACFEETITILK